MTTSTSDIDRIDQRADAAHHAYQLIADTILNDGDLNIEAKRRRVEEATAGARAQLAALMTQRTLARDAIKAARTRELFGHIVAPSSSEVLNRRDADERANRLDGQASALEALERAELTGDNILARSITLAGLEKGWPEVVNAYRSIHPGAADALDQLADIEREESTGLYGWRYSLVARGL
ncbi:hypothetical protein [Marisediminicola antarctica]|uniref:Uncharacterized protein n=1 Tax=Marisediminicola antarctica TaxID=674079 RepID=A0A7L5AN97_9MICO|nr:hypothetical protein [Marisediminicola antarctica]QHO70784.1 hypothetical protein BHD05_15140 [Marisediminicola antarctica]